MKNLLTPESKEQSGIYIIRNTINAKVYIGSAVRLISRFRGHLCDLNKGKHNQRLLNFVRKYGVETLEFSMLELVEEKETLLEREQYWIDFYDSSKSKNGFNICPSAGSNIGSKMPDSQRQACRKRMTGNTYWKGKKHTEETKLKCGIASKKRVWTEESSAKLSASKKGVNPFEGKNHPMLGRIGELNPKFGIPLSEETCKNISESKKGSKNPMFGKVISPEQKARTKGKLSKSLICKNKEGETVKTYSCISDTKADSFSPANVSKACNLKAENTIKNYYKGFYWSFI